MIQSAVYVDLRHNRSSLNDLDEEERKAVARLQRRARTHRDWYDFENYWQKLVWDLYRPRGLSREEAAKTVVFRIAQDLSSRIAIESGLARAPDYRDQLADLIRRRFRTRREFCKATGISEDMLSHVLARRKHLAIETLQEALARIGCTLRIMPLEPTESRTAHS